MGKSSSGRSRTGSEVSASRSERRRSTIDDNESTSTVNPSRTKPRTDSITSGTSSSRRKSSRRDTEDYVPESSSRRASSYSAGSYPPSSATYRTADDGDQDGTSRAERRETSRRERGSIISRDGGRSESTRALDDDNNRGDDQRSSYSRRDSEKNSNSSKRRDSRRQSTSSNIPERRESQREGSRALSEQDHNAALPQNQFPNEIPDEFTAPYRPPGLAQDYYGDHGESVQFQPGVRPNIPNIIQSADQAHLHEPTMEAHPPPEPSSLGHVGAAASYFGTDGGSGAGGLTTPSRPSQQTSSGQPQSSPRASPGPPDSRPSAGRPPSFGANVGSTGAAAAAGAGMGLAAEYFAGHDFTSQTNNQSTSHQSFQQSSQHGQYNQGSQSQYASGPQNQFPQDFQGGYGSVSRPPKQSSTGAGLGTAAVAGLAAAGAASYLSHQHDSHSHSQGQQSQYVSGSVSNLAGGQSQTSLSLQQQQRLKQKHKHQGPISRFVDWFRDPSGVAQYEAYTEAIGLCKYCFDPNSSPLDAPRKHHYCNGRPSSVNPDGKFTSRRVTKAYRYSNGSSSSLSSSDGERRRRKTSTGKKMVAAGLAGAGAVKIGEALYNRRNDFDDTYSVRSGRPVSDMQQRMQTNASRIEAEEAEARRRSERRQSTRTRHESTEDVRLDRKSSTTSRKSRRDSEGVEVRRSSRRDNSGSPSRLSRGQAMSIGAGAAATAAVIGAEVARRRRSRSRSRSRSNSPTLRRKKSYYSKRVSPKHSYVDLSTKNTGPLGFGGFFSSPSANEKRGKTKKGLFVFRNDSSSSSDADLAFGEGTIKRKLSKKDKSRRDSKDGSGGRDALLGLAATGAALAAESEHRRSSGKSRRDTNGKPGRSSAYKISMQDNETATSDVNDEGMWEDASDGESVDAALAYGGGLSAKTSRESLAEQGTSKWNWRWKDKKVKKASGNERRQSESFARPQSSHFDAAATGAVGAGIAAAAANAISPRPSPAQHQPHYVFSEPSPGTMPPMQYVDPFATSNPGFFDARATSTVDGGPSPHTFESRSPAPLKQPQPQSASFSNIASAKPTVLDKIEAEAKLTGSPEEISSSERTRLERRDRADSQERTRPLRRDSSPPLINNSTTSRNSVMFHLTDEQIEAERLANEKEERRRRRKERDRDGKRRSGEFGDPPIATPVSGAASAPDLTRNAKVERSKESRSTPVNEHEDRQAAIERELEALYAQQDRYMKQQKELDEYRRKHGESGGVAAALIGAGVGAAATAMIKDKKSSESESDRKPQRKSSLKKGSQERVVTPSHAPSEFRAESPPKETQQERIARMAAQRVRSTPSPVHEDYSTFFVPEEIAGNVKVHNEAAEKRVHDLANVITIDPDDGSPVQPTFDPFVYLQYGLSRRHDASKYGWDVPRLELEEPTPPGSRSSSRTRQGKVDPESPVSPARGGPVAAVLPRDSLESVTDEDLPRPVATSSTGSKVTFGGHSTHEYEVQTPEYERNDPHNDHGKNREVEPLEDNVPESTARESARKVYSVDRRGDTPKVTEVPPVEEMTPKQREHVSRGKDFEDLPPVDQETPKRPSIHDAYAAPIYEHREPSPSPEPSPMAEPDLKELLGSKYMAPFSETVSDLGDIGDYSHRDVPKTGQGFIESKELPITPTVEGSTSNEAPHDIPKESNSVAVDDLPHESRLSRSERRRMERAMSSSENVTPVIHTSQPEPDNTTRNGISEHPAVQEMQEKKPKERKPDMGVFDFLVDENNNPIPPSDIPTYNDLVKSAVSQISRGNTERTQKSEEKHAPAMPPKPHRSQTLDDSQFEREVARSADYASDPEDWERKSGKKSRKSTESSSASKSDVGFGTKAALAGVAGGAIAATVAAAAHAEPDFYAAEKEKPRESRRKKRESEIFDEYDGKSTVSLPATKDEDKKSRRRSKRRDSDDIEDEDRKSIASLPATKDEDDRSRRKKRDSDVFNNDDDDAKSVKSTSSEKRKSRDKESEKEREKEKRSSGFFGLFGKSSDVSTSSKKSSKSESRADRDRAGDKHDEDREKRRKRRSKGDGYYDDTASIASEPLRSSRRSKSRDVEEYEKAAQESRDVSVDDGFVSADDGQQSKPESFLAERPEMPTPMATKPVMDTVMPMVTDGVSGPKTENVVELPAQLESQAEKIGHSTEEHDSRMPDQFPLPTQSPEEEKLLSENDLENDLPLLATTPQADRQRRLSAIRTAGYASSPIAAHSPTAVPLQFGRRYPVTPGGSVQSAVRSSPIAAIPSSPLGTPRTRQGRPKSSDFSSSREYRPLYLVEHHSAAKAATPDIDENLPSLPSSRTTSAHPSTEDLRGQAMTQLEGREDDYFTQPLALDVNESDDVHDHRPASPDFLDSRSTTPVPGEKQRARDQELVAPPQMPQPQQPLSAEEIQERRARQREREMNLLFHSPSELLQDPVASGLVQPADVEIAEENRAGSPLPSVVSTSQDEEFLSAESGRATPVLVEEEPRQPIRRSSSRERSRSPQNNNAIVAGLGVLGGVAAGAAVGMALKSEVSGESNSGEAESRQMLIEDTALPPARREDTNVDDVQEDTETAASTKKSKKKKNSKRKSMARVVTPTEVAEPELVAESVNEHSGEVPLTLQNDMSSEIVESQSMGSETIALADSPKEVTTDDLSNEGLTATERNAKTTSASDLSADVAHEDSKEPDVFKYLDLSEDQVPKSTTPLAVGESVGQSIETQFVESRRPSMDNAADTLASRTNVPRDIFFDSESERLPVTIEKDMDVPSPAGAREEPVYESLNRDTLEEPTSSSSVPAAANAFLPLVGPSSISTPEVEERTREAEQPIMVSGKKGKKDKKKKRSTLNISEPMAASEPEPNDEVAAISAEPQVEAAAKPTSIDPFVSESTMAGTESEPILSETAPTSATEQSVLKLTSGDEQAQPQSSKKSKKKGKGKKSTIEDRSPDVADVVGGSEVEAVLPLTEGPKELSSDKSDLTLGAGIAAAAAGSAYLTNISTKEQTDMAATEANEPVSSMRQISEEASTNESHAGGSTLPDTPGLPELTRTTSFQPTAAQLADIDNDLGAFEQAFERALQSRGLAGSVTREEALEAFLPRRDNAPFVPKGGLTPVPEGTPATVPTTPNEEMGGLSRKSSKKEKRKAKKASDADTRSSNESLTILDKEWNRGGLFQDAEQTTGKPSSAIENSFGQDFDMEPSVVVETPDPHPKSFESNPFGNDFEIKHATDEAKEQPTTAMDENPFGDDFEVKADDQTAVRVPEESQLESTVQQSDRDLKDAPQQSDKIQERASFPVQESEEAQASVTKKDKKKKRREKISAQYEEPNQSQTPVEEASREFAEPLLEDSTHEPMETTAPLGEEVSPYIAPEDSIGAEQLSTVPKSKKDKKKKRNQDQSSKSAADFDESAELQEERPRELGNQRTEDVDTELQTEDGPADPIDASESWTAQPSSKKSKKDKKKKKQSGSSWVDDLGSAAAVAGTVAAGAAVVGMLVSTDGKSEIVEEPKEIENTDKDGEARDSLTTAQGSADVTEDYAPVTEKKSKKDKKKKKSKSVMSSDWENDEAITAVDTSQNEESSTQMKSEAALQSRDVEPVVPAVPEMPAEPERENLSRLQDQDEHGRKEPVVMEPAVPEIPVESAETPKDFYETHQEVEFADAAERTPEGQQPDVSEQVVEEGGAEPITAVLGELDEQADLDRVVNVEAESVDKKFDLAEFGEATQTDRSSYRDDVIAEDSKPPSEQRDFDLSESAVPDTEKPSSLPTPAEIVKQSHEVAPTPEDSFITTFATKKSKKDKKKNKKRQSVTWEDESSPATPSASGAQTPAEPLMESQQSVRGQNTRDDLESESVRDIDDVQTSDVVPTSTEQGQVQEGVIEIDDKAPVEQIDHAKDVEVPDSITVAEEPVQAMYSEPVTPVEEPSRPIPEAQPIDDWTAPPKKTKKGKKAKAKGPPAPWDNNLSLGQAAGIALAGTAALLGAAVAKKGKEKSSLSPSSFKPYRTEAVEAQETADDKSMQPLELTPTGPLDSERVQQPERADQAERTSENAEKTLDATDTSQVEAPASWTDQNDRSIEEQQDRILDSATSVPLPETTLHTMQTEDAAPDVPAQVGFEREVAAPSSKDESEEPQADGKHDTFGPVAGSSTAGPIQVEEEESFKDVGEPPQVVEMANTGPQPDSGFETTRGMDKEDNVDATSSTRKSKKDKKKKRKSSIFETSEPATPVEETEQALGVNDPIASPTPAEPASDDTNEAAKTTADGSKFEQVKESDESLDRKLGEVSQESEGKFEGSQAITLDESIQHDSGLVPAETAELLAGTTALPRTESDAARDITEVSTDHVDPIEVSQESQVGPRPGHHSGDEGETGALRETDQTWDAGLSKKERKKKKKAMEAQGVTFDEFDQPTFPVEDERPAPEAEREAVAEVETLLELEPAHETPSQDNAFIEEESALPLSRKKSKKEKKKQKPASSASMEDSSSLTGEEPKASEDNIESETMGLVKDASDFEREGLVTEDVPSATTDEVQVAQVVEPDAESFSSIPRTKSKKDKKKRKSGLSTPISDPVTPAEDHAKEYEGPKTTEPTEQLMELGTAAEPAELNEPGSKSEPEPEQEQSISEPAIVPSAALSDEPLQEMVTQPEPNREIQEPNEARSGPSDSLEDEQVLPDNEPEGEDIWTVPAKKSKKDKKKKGKASTVTPAEDQTAFAEEQNEEPAQDVVLPAGSVAVETIAVDPMLIDDQQQVVDLVTIQPVERVENPDERVEEAVRQTPEPSLSAVSDSALISAPPGEQSQDVTDVVPEVEAEDAQISANRKSKKSKKKRKSTLSTPAEEPSTPADESADGPFSESIEQANLIAAEPESMDLEPRSQPFPDSLEATSHQFQDEAIPKLEHESGQDERQLKPEDSIPISIPSSHALEVTEQTPSVEESLPASSTNDADPIDAGVVPARDPEEHQELSQRSEDKSAEEPVEAVWAFSSKKSKKDKKKRKSGSTTPAEGSTIIGENAIGVDPTTRDLSEMQTSTVEDELSQKAEAPLIENNEPVEDLTLSRKLSKKDKRKKQRQALYDEQDVPKLELGDEPAQGPSDILDEPQILEEGSQIRDAPTEESYQQIEPRDFASDANEKVLESLPNPEAQADPVQAERDQDDQSLKTVQELSTTETTNDRVPYGSEILDDEVMGSKAGQPEEKTAPEEVVSTRDLDYMSEVRQSDEATQAESLYDSAQKDQPQGESGDTPINPEETPGSDEKQLDEPTAEEEWSSTSTRTKKNKKKSKRKAVSADDNNETAKIAIAAAATTAVLGVAVPEHEQTAEQEIEAPPSSEKTMRDMADAEAEQAVIDDYVPVDKEIQDAEDAKQEQEVIDDYTLPEGKTYEDTWAEAEVAEQARGEEMDAAVEDLLSDGSKPKDEDTSWIKGSKKGKKGKKSKRSSGSTDEPSQLSIPVPEVLPEARSVELNDAANEEQVTVVDELEQATSATVPEQPLVTPAAEQSDGFSWTSALKRDKKGKKKRRSVAWADDDTSTPATPANEKSEPSFLQKELMAGEPTEIEPEILAPEEPQREPEKEEPISKEADLGLTENDLSLMPTLEETSTSGMKSDLPTPATEKDDFTWEAPPSKKKGKKNKKSRESTSNLEESSVSTDLPQVRSVEDSASTSQLQDTASAEASVTEDKPDKKRRSSFDGSEEPSTKRAELDGELAATGREAILVGENTDMPSVLLAEGPLEAIDDHESTSMYDASAERALETQEPADLSTAQIAAQTAVANIQEPEPTLSSDTAEIAAQTAFNEAAETDEPVIQRDIDLYSESQQLPDAPAEADEDTWGVSTKKSKKDKKKKKRESQADGSSAVEAALAGTAAVAGIAAMSKHESHISKEDQETPQPSSIPEANQEPAQPTVEAPRHENTTVRQEEPSVEEDQTFTSKKSKKDKKKKKRESVLAEPAEESTSGKASAESLAGPYIPNYADEMVQHDLGDVDYFRQSSEAIDNGSNQMLPRDARKAQRKERQHLTKEDLESTRSAAGHDEEDTTRDVKMTDAGNAGHVDLVTEEAENPVDIEDRGIEFAEAEIPAADSNSVETASAAPDGMQDSMFEEAPRAMSEEKFESELRNDSPWELVEPGEKSEPSIELLEAQTVAEPAVVEPEEEVGSSTNGKKSKKAKRKQLASVSQDQIQAATNVSINDAAKPVSAEPPALDDQPVSSTFEEVEAASRQESEPVIVENEEWTSDTKKSKNGKKKKRGSKLDVMEKLSQDPEEVVNVVGQVRDVEMADVPFESSSHVDAEGKENRDDNFAQSRAVDVEDRIPAVAIEPEPTDEWATPSKKSKKDKKKKRKSTVDVSEDVRDPARTPRSSQSQVMMIDEPMATEPDQAVEALAPQVHSIEDLHNEPAHQAWLTGAFESASQFPSKPIAKEEHLSATSTPSATKPEDTSSASSKKSKKGKKARKVSEQQPEAIEEQAARGIVPDTELIMADQGQESDGSNISESTRERRKRRRSPPLQRDHDPEDLPRSPGDRALTPPPEHDDLMDTALGIAAGLGLGASEAEQHHDTHMTDKTIRDSGVQFDDPSTAQTGSSVRDSGFVPSPLINDSWSASRGRDMQLPEPQTGRPIRPHSPTSSTEDVRFNRRSIPTEPAEESQHAGHLGTSTRNLLETPARRQPSPVNPTSKDRSSVLFHSSPAGQTPKTPHSGKKSQSESNLETPTSGLRRSPSIHSHHRSQEELHTSSSPSARRMSNELASSLINRAEAVEVDRSAFSPSPVHSPERPFSPTRTPLQTIHESQSGQHNGSLALGTLAASGLAAGALAASTRDDPTHRTRSLGKSKSRTGSLRDLRSNTTSPFNGPDLQPTPSRAPINETGASAEGAARNMAESFEGLGSYPASPASPTRPPSVKRRQSMQQIRDLEARVDQLADENRSLAEAKLMAERHLQDFQIDRNKNDFATDEALRTLNEQLRQRDEEIVKLREQIETLAHTHESLKSEHETRYSALQDEHNNTHAQWQQSTRELGDLKSQHEELSSGMDDTVRRGIDSALAEKNAEVQRLRRDLEAARQKIRELQSQILSHGADEILVVRDEDYFDNACQALCQHVQQWVLRFSKFSDTRVCYGTDQVKDEKVVDRFDNAILDGSEVDSYLSDRVKRRDVFMSVVMTMIWEYVFTRYLFGMDRDQRQKLKQLEKNLLEVGPVNAVHQWRALTLTLLSKREVFRQQRESDSEAVVIEIMKTLKKFLPPPQNLEGQIHESLRKVMRTAVDLSIEMRTQKAEYIMLPPLQPEYNTEGDLARKVYFNASLMNERSGETSSNEELESSRAVVRIVLFPLVVKQENDSGKDSEKIVVCPAQVLVARPDKGKRPKSRLASGGSDRMSIDQRAMKSTQSLGAMSGIEPSQGNMF